MMVDSLLEQFFNPLMVPPTCPRNVQQDHDLGRFLVREGAQDCRGSEAPLFAQHLEILVQVLYVLMHHD